MSADSDKLREMIVDAPDKSDNIANGVSQITDVRDEVNEEISAVQNGMCGSAQTQMTNRLTTVKLPFFQLTYPTAILSFGASYGTNAWSDPGPVGNITDWEIYYMTIVVPPAVPVKVVLYKYLTTGWDGDADIIAWANGYHFGNDYLTRPLDTGATYGLIPYRDNLNTAISILTENKAKVDSSVSFFEPYAT